MPKSKSLNILIVDDNSTTREMLLKVLSGLGHNVTVADSSGVALAYLKSTTFDRVLCDFNLGPHSWGSDVIILNQSTVGPNSNTPMALMSGGDDINQAKNIAKELKVLFLQKPLVPSVLEDAINKQMK